MTLSFDLIALGAWEGESISVYIDGEKILDVKNPSDTSASTTGTAGLYGWSFTELYRSTASGELSVD